jgi:hypothetical protein
MKKGIIFILLILTLGFVSCDKYDGCVDSRSNKDSRNTEIIHFGVIQNYGLCDSVCIGHSTIILDDLVQYEEGYYNTYVTGPDSVFDGGYWLKTVSFEFTYLSNVEFTMETNDECYLLRGTGTKQINLNCNQLNYITVQ